MLVRLKGNIIVSAVVVEVIGDKLYIETYLNTTIVVNIGNSANASLALQKLFEDSKLNLRTYDFTVE